MVSQSSICYKIGTVSMGEWANLFVTKTVLSEHCESLQNPDSSNSVKTYFIIFGNTASAFFHSLTHSSHTPKKPNPATKVQ